MLQNFLLLFQRFPLAPGFSTRHKCDMARERAEDLKLLRTVARELRSSRPLDLGSRLWLADHIDPDGDSKRHLRFANRRRGNTEDTTRDSEIAEYVWNAGGKVEGQVEAAVKETIKSKAVERFHHLV
jgi:hypothetical protein